MKSRDLSRGFFAPPRIILIIVLFSVLISLFCSKGDKTISPVLPPLNADLGKLGTDLPLADNENGERQNFSLFKPQISPFMPYDAVIEMDEKLIEIIGDIDLPQDQLLFLFVRSYEISKTYPPLIFFAFAASKDALTIGDISIQLDSVDISDKIKYSIIYKRDRKANYYLGVYQPENYLSPLRQHHFDIDISPPKGNHVHKVFHFSGNQEVDSRVISANFLWDNVEKTPIFNQLMVKTNIPREMKISEMLLGPDRWEIKYDDGNPFPLIKGIKYYSPQNKTFHNIFIITFEENVLPEKPFAIAMLLSEGLKSKVYKGISPHIPISRGGGIYRQVANISCSDCTGIFTGVFYNYANGCEDNSSYTISTNCPPKWIRPPDQLHPCQHFFREETRGVTTYFYDPQKYYTEPSDDGDPYPENVAPQKSSSCYASCPNYTFYEEADIDYEGCWSMNANIPPPYQPPSHCYWLDDISISMERADSYPPTVTGCITEEYHNGSGQGFPSCPTGCEDCWDSKSYYFDVQVEDNMCLGYGTKIFIYYSNGDVFDCSQIWWWWPTQPADERHAYPRFWIDDINIFQCATKLKIIFFDRTGNWGSCEIPCGGNVPYQLPYPSSVSLSFGLRVSPEMDQKQYVNLTSYYYPIPNPEVCWPVMIAPSECGNWIYIVVSVLPPIPGVELRLCFEDPPFKMDDNDLPTNYVDINNPDRDNYTSGNNPDLTDEEYYRLWGSHKAYGHDKVTYGDNYNYYPGDNSQASQVVPPIPSYDPILTGPPQRSSPYFYYGPPGFAPIYGSPCIDLYTNIHGKVAVLFNTQKHGGDNFKFKVFKKRRLVWWGESFPTGECVDCEEDCDNCERCQGNCPDCGSKCAQCQDCDFCLKSEPSPTFTVWRRMYVDYAWMRDRNGEYDISCYYHGHAQEEFTGDHEIAYGDFSYIEGVFDDCFIEIEKAEEYENRPYHLALDGQDGRPNRDEYMQSWVDDVPPNDTILLIGIDHLEPTCLLNSWKIGFAQTTKGYEKDFRCWTCVGCIYDFTHNGVFQIIDGKEIWNEHIITLRTAAHECDHSFMQWDSHNWPYGLMCESDYVFIDSEKVPGRRHYLHSNNIMQLRHLLNFFDQDNY